MDFEGWVLLLLGITLIWTVYQGILDAINKRGLRKKLGRIERELSSLRQHLAVFSYHVKKQSSHAWVQPSIQQLIANVEDTLSLVPKELLDDFLNRDVDPTHGADAHSVTEHISHRKQ